MTITYGPCTWPDLTHLCCPDWGGYSEALQTQSLEYAKLIIWAATGRQYGLCELTVRPCGRQCNNCPAGWYWDGGGTWVPYIWNGQWYNCWCGGNGPGGCCTCDPDCRVYLPGPVHSVTSVTVDGATLAVSGDYFVINQQWLVRSDTAACWPLCADQNLQPGDPNVFEVTYLRGRAVPTAVANATAVLACEYAKACLGLPCRLPGRMTSLARQGMTISMVDPTEMLKSGLTGLWEVDMVIMSVNPMNLKGQTRYWSPELQEGNQVTWS